ncbi:ATP synthase subunit I [Geobacter sp. AOG1]|uniref:ATP synthase subunit I n=1 Tax=Geobacter sp. AOG1 TaxID=1566346 RepID=UPI001CC766BA|nr:ATP synthase subunit I [Geobacter sp. AOG1]GFE56897.1 ATP synthase subunit I [Geobacter sp. AOG1]
MTVVTIKENDYFTAVTTGSWCLLAALTIGGACFGSLRFAGGVLAGGLIAIGNYYWLLSIMQRVLYRQQENPERFAILRYLLRLTVIGALIYLLIVKLDIDIRGLLLGLSILVMTITALALYMLNTKGE